MIWVFNDHLINSPKVIAHKVMGFLIVEETSEAEGEAEHGGYPEEAPRRNADVLTIAD